MDSIFWCLESFHQRAHVGDLLAICLGDDAVVNLIVTNGGWGSDDAAKENETFSPFFIILGVIEGIQ